MSPIVPSAATVFRQIGSQLRRATAAVLALTATSVVAADAKPVDFHRDIEPLLIKRCSECHGPDKQKGDLRLDLQASALKGGKSGKAAVKPGHAADSTLIQRILSTDPDEVMPSKGERLSADQVALLTVWINQGATWPATDVRKHWAFVKPERPELPPVKDAGWVRNEIDRFILARLEQEGLHPQAEADRATLLRRLSLDLTGLPPTWGEVEAFVKDSSPKAYESAVDRLLASPHYGENMARGWLDLARYADSNGYQVDLARSIWPYRDWVIRAFNENKRFDQFTIEQLAGDLLPNPTIDQRVATGFNRNTKINDEGGGDAEEYRVKAVKDRLATFGTAWLGLTINCAECHSHKYDPISHEDYYRLYAFFNNSTDGGNYSSAPNLEVPQPDRSRILAHLDALGKSARAKLAAAEAALPARQSEWEKRTRKTGEVWQTLALTKPYSTGGSGYTNLPDGSLLATGVNPIYDTITVESETNLTGITAVMLEVLPDPSLPKNGPGRWGQTGNFILDEFGVAAAPRVGAPPAETNLVMVRARADWEQPYYRAEHAIDRNPKTGWAIGPKFGERHFLIAEFKEPTGFAGGTRLSFRFDHYHGNSHCLGRFRISVTREKDPAALWPVPRDIREGLAVSESKRDPALKAKIASWYRSADPDLRQGEREVARIEQRRKDIPKERATTLVMQERSEPTPRTTHIHNRGNFLDPGKEVTAGVPEVFPPLPAGETPNRLALAKWLVSGENPLTARVVVNRHWEHTFGTGLVKTSEDFGRQGEAPSHPALLDWLSTELVRTGWDIKALQKKLVMSATYRQSAAADAVRLEKDFYNRLLSRGPRFRMDGEVIRDHALAVSGLLNPDVGGPSVYPVQIPNLWKEIGFLRPEIGMDEWPVSEGPELYRRGVYTFWRRVCTYPTFATFDAPSREVCVARRPRTNTPLQALAGLNDPTLLEAARAFAQRILSEGGSDPKQQLEFAFRTCLGRLPTASETARLRAFLDQQLRSYRGDKKSADALIAVGSASRPATIDSAKLAAWMMVANVLFNLDETLTKG